MTAIKQSMARFLTALCCFAWVGCTDDGGEQQVAAVNPPPPPPPNQGQPDDEPVKPRKIIGKTTQDIRDAEVEVNKGAVAKEEKKLEMSDPITLSGNAYVHMVGKVSILKIEHAVKLFHGLNGRYPKDYKEFMDKIVKANNISLPTLPYYQEFGYNAKEHKLVILEYPDRKL